MGTLNMWNGFFDLRNIQNIESLKQLYRDALELSNRAEVDYLDCSESWRRQRHLTLTPKEYIEKHITLGTHNVVIDRGAYYSMGDREGEIGSGTNGKVSLFLFLFLSTDDLYEIVDKYKLTKKLI